ncbi:hypothetical protein NKR23_g67 [Pleurostoma richardsiae]|uniref:Uncharacterized protein n=1 Tax=Pleurostoma richardsiae TaxID=41990 RepID=A0AA38RVC5_9PEZI|nr:hypothetical protein NKR23_g67 [Pleurostoma richardsiae]
MSDISQPSSRTLGASFLGRSSPFTATPDSGRPASVNPASSLGREAIAAEACRWFMSDFSGKKNAAAIAAVEQDLTKKSDALKLDISTIRQSLDVERAVSKSAVENALLRLELFKSEHEKRYQELQQTIRTVQQEIIAVTKGLTRLETLRSDVHGKSDQLQQSLNTLEKRLADGHAQLAKIETEQSLYLSGQDETTVALEEQLDDLKETSVKDKREMVTNFLNALGDRTREVRGEIQQSIAALRAETLEGLQERDELDRPALEFVRKLMTRGEDLMTVLNNAANQILPVPQRVGEAEHTDTSDIVMEDEAKPTEQPVAQGGGPGHAISKEGAEDKPGESRYEAFFRHLVAAKQKYRLHKPSRDSRFIRTFIAGIEDRGIRDLVQTHLLEQLPQTVITARERGARGRNSVLRITLKKDLTWAQVVQALKKLQRT